MASLQDPEETDTTEQDTGSLCPKKVLHCLVNTAKVLRVAILKCDTIVERTDSLCFTLVVLFVFAFLQNKGTLWSF